MHDNVDKHESPRADICCPVSPHAGRVPAKGTSVDWAGCINLLFLLSNTTGDTSGAVVASPSRAPELTLVFVEFVLLLH